MSTFKLIFLAFILAALTISSALVTEFYIAQLPKEFEAGAKQPEEPVLLNRIYVDSRALHVEFARTPEELKKGLAKRAQLPPESEGMLFIFPEEKPMTFWMLDTTLSLTLVYFDAGGKFVAAYDMEPEPGVAKEKLSVYKSIKPVKYALEVSHFHGIARKIRMEHRPVTLTILPE